MKAAPQQSPAQILIVEDNPVNRKLVSEVLESAGFQVVRAADAEQAQLLLQARIPDLILTDIGLPGMDGLSFVRYCRSDARLREIPIVALTAFAMKGDEQKAMAAGCDGYITKPIKTRELPQQVRSFLTAVP